MLGWLGLLTGMAGEVMSKEQARRRLMEHKEEVIKEMSQDHVDRSTWTWRHVTKPVLISATLELLNVLGEDSQILLQRDFEFEGGHRLTPSWPIGVYLEGTGLS
mmetsp:Transcript_4826/g.9603  ORF Transcript_4826/g.9603 Transcript_4826/m.9603 type:complete len:104 (-) Transcript_4826:93-404(-)